MDVTEFDPIAGLDFPDTEIVLTSVGDVDVLSVTFLPGKHHGDGRFHAVAVDGDGLRFALRKELDVSYGGPDPMLKSKGVSETFRNWLSEATLPEWQGKFDEETEVSLSTFGILPSGRGRNGLETGDLAVTMAAAMEKAYPSLDKADRILTVTAIQRRYLAMGLRRIIDRIGENRIDLHQLYAYRFDPFRNDLGRLRMDAAKAATLMEAARAYPQLGPYVSRAQSKLSGGETPHATAIEMLGFYGLDRPASGTLLRRISSGLADTVIPSASMVVLREIPRDWIPASGDAAEWKALARLANCLATASERTKVPISVLAGACGGRWQEYAERLAQASGTDLSVIGTLDGGDVFGRIQGACGDLFGMSADMETTLADPLLSWAAGEEVRHHSRDGREFAQELLFSGKGLVRILAISAAWHAEGGVRTPGHLHGTRAWEAILPPAAHGDVLIVPLTSQTALSDEGMLGTDVDGRAGLHHCVATHWENCASGKTRIMGVVNAADRARISTVEIRFGRDDGTPAISEHKGFRNATPPPEAEEAVRAYMAGLLDGTLEYDRAAVAAARRRSSQGNVAERCGYDWRDPDMLAQVIAAWSPYLARPLRNLGPAAFMGALGREPAMEAVEELRASPGGP